LHDLVVFFVVTPGSLPIATYANVGDFT